MSLSNAPFAVSVPPPDVRAGSCLFSPQSRRNRDESDNWHTEDVPAIVELFLGMSVTSILPCVISPRSFIGQNNS